MDRGASVSASRHSQSQSRERIDWYAADVHAFKLRDVVLKNRIVVSPMAQYSAEDGVAGDYHLVHLGSRAMGGAGLVFAEMTCVSAEGRITPACPGLYKPEHTAAWKRIVDFVHTNTDAKIAVQLGHAGAKGATKRVWDGIDQPLDEGGWPLISASAPAIPPVSRKWPEPQRGPKWIRSLQDFVSATIPEPIKRASIG